MNKGTMMDTDITLLELAAKAAGYHVACWPCKDNGFMFGFVHAKDGGKWNPLTDDGDAMRLAVKLKILCESRYQSYVDEQEYAIDPCKAIRRAIVCIAAEIGSKIS